MSVVQIPAGSPESAYVSAAQQARASLRPGFGTVPDAQGSTVIQLGPGDHVLHTPGALLGNEGMTQKGSGLVFAGAGPCGVTTVMWSPSAPGALMSNNWWHGVRFRDIRFATSAKDQTLMASYTTQSAQDYAFIDCEWVGFKYVLDEQGNDNNSEMKMSRCANYSMQSDGALIHIGAANTSDQFLNFWVDDLKHWGTAAPIVDAAKGGHFSLARVDCSNWGAGANNYLFNLRGNSHANGVCAFEVRGLRAELMNGSAGLLYSEWGIGNVVLDHVDLSSQVGGYPYGEVISMHSTPPNPGPMVHLADSELVGTIGIHGSSPGTRLKAERTWFWLQQNPFNNCPPNTVRAEDCFCIQPGSVTPVTSDVGGTGPSDMFTNDDRQLLVDARNASVDFSWVGYAPLGFSDGTHTDRNGNLIPKGLPLTPKDYYVQKFGPA